MADLQTLFSLEVDIDFVHVQPSGVICRIPAVAFRLIDFPTLLIHHLNPGNVEKIKESLSASVVPLPFQLKELKDYRGNFVFKKGKSCLFKSNIDNLLAHLSNTPLYVMIIDMWPAVPKLVGNCSVPLQSTIENIIADVERTGISVPTVHGTKDIYKVYNLMGSEIGYVSLGFKLLSLGAGLISHIPESSITKPLSSRKNPQNIDSPKKLGFKTSPKTKKDKGDIVLEDLEEFNIVDESELEIQTTKPDSEAATKELRSSMTQTRCRLVKPKKASKKCVSVIQCTQDDSELGLFVTNIVCPPPLFFNSKYEDLPDKPDNLPPKKAFPPKPDESEDSFSLAGFVETHYVYPPDSQQSIGKIHRKSHHKPPDNVKFPSPEHCSVGVQSSPDIRTVTSGLINQNLPILAALLRELSVLHGNRPVDTAHSPPHKVMHSPRTAVPLKNDRTCDEPEKVGTRTVLKQASNRVKDVGYHRPTSAKKKPKLKFGMTHSQKLRLQRNNPELLKTLEKQESKEKKDKVMMNSTYKTPKKTDRQKRTKERNQECDASSQSTESESNKENRILKAEPRQRPVPAPRRSKESLSNKSNKTGPTQENEEIQSYMRITGIDESIDQEMSENGNTSHQACKDGSGASTSRRIEVHIPSVSNDTIVSDSDITNDLTDHLEADIAIGHVSPKKIQYPGFVNKGKDITKQSVDPVSPKKRVEYPGFVSEREDFSRQSDGRITVDDISHKKTKHYPEFVHESDSDKVQKRGIQNVLTEERKPDKEGRTDGAKSVHGIKHDELTGKEVKRIDVPPRPELKVEFVVFEQSDDFEQTTEGDVLEGAQFEYNYSTDFDVGDDNEEFKGRQNEEVLEYAEFEGSYSYDFEEDDHAKGNDGKPLEVVDGEEVDSFASLSTTTSSEQSASQRSLGHPLPHSSRLQKGSLAMPKPTISSKSPLPNRKNSGHSSGVFPTTTRTAIPNRNVDMPLNTRSSGNSEFLTGDSDILQSTVGTGRTKSSYDYEPSYSDLLTDGSREF